MKLLISTTSGVSASLIKGQGKYFKDCGYEVIYSCSDEGYAKKLSNEEGLVFEPIPFLREINFFNDLYCLFLACKILIKHKPDIVNAGTPKAGLIYMLASSIVRIKCRVFTLRGLRSNTLTGIRKKIVYFSEKISCSCATKVIAISPSLKEEALNLNLVSENKVVVLAKGSSNGVDIKRFCVNEILIKNSQKKKEELNFLSDTFIFGFIGRIVKDKGIKKIIEAFEKIQNEYKVKLLLIGDYESDDFIGDDYIQKINGNKDIIKTGYVEDVPMYSYIFDVLILASYREGFGNVVIEAAAMGKPAIVSDIPGARDTIENGRTGIYIQARDMDSLYSAMKFYLEDKNRVVEHGNNAKDRVRQYFINEIIWKEQEKLYKLLLKK